MRALLAATIREEQQQEQIGDRVGGCAAARPLLTRLPHPPLALPLALPIPTSKYPTYSWPHLVQTLDVFDNSMEGSLPPAISKLHNLQVYFSAHTLPSRPTTPHFLSQPPRSRPSPPHRPLQPSSLPIDESLLYRLPGDACTTRVSYPLSLLPLPRPLRLRRNFR